MAKITKKYFESIRNWFDALKDRERRLLLILIAVLASILVIGTGVYTASLLGSKRDRIAKIESQIDEIRSIESRYRKAKATAIAEERKFSSNTISLFSFLQGTANRLGLTLSDLNEQKTPVSDSKLIETSVAVNLKQLSIDKLTALLEAIEDTNPGGVVKVTKLKVKTRFDQPDLLDVQMMVSTWKSA